MRQNDRAMRKTQRDIERERADLERQEKKLVSNVTRTDCDWFWFINIAGSSS